MSAAVHEASEPSLLERLQDELPHLFSADGSKEIGIAAIFTWFHAIHRLCERNPQYAPLPPVLISTLSVLGGLGLLHGTAGRRATQQIVAYFDPSVQFLGNYMSLWLVPPLVLLPKAVERIPNRCASLWIKLVLVHFSLWAASVGGMAVLATLLEGGAGAVWDKIALLTGYPSPLALAAPPPTASLRASNGVICATPDAPAPHAPTSYAAAASDSLRPNHNSRAPASHSSNNSSNSGWGVALGPTRAPELQAKLKVIRFWGVVSATFYAAAAAHQHIPAVRRWPLYPFLSTYTPALTTTAITVFTAGTALPPHLKKCLHPLILTALVSGGVVMALGGDGSEAAAAAAAAAGGGVGEGVGVGSSLAAVLPLGTSRWRALHSFTSAQRAAGQGLLHGLKAGDFLSLFLGPSCTALAFRIYSKLCEQVQEGDLQALYTALLVSVAQAALSLGLSPLVGRVAGLPRELNVMLAHRTVTSALAIPAAQATGASPELTTASVLVTGLYGASGAWLYDHLSLSDAGLGAVVGSTSHTIGTSELVSSQPSAAGTASIAMFVTGLVHAALCALPGGEGLLHRLGGV